MCKSWPLQSRNVYFLHKSKNHPTNPTPAPAVLGLKDYLSLKCSCGWRNLQKDMFPPFSCILWKCCTCVLIPSEKSSGASESLFFFLGGRRGCPISPMYYSHSLTWPSQQDEHILLQSQFDAGFWRLTISLKHHQFVLPYSYTQLGKRNLQGWHVGNLAWTYAFL